MASNFSRDVQNLIAQFRGLPQNHSRSNLRESKSIDKLLDSCIKSYKIGQVRPEDQIMANWKDIVGAKNSHRCCPKTISRGNLIITTSNPIVRSELQFNRHQILKHLRSLPGCENISGITLMAG